MKKYRCTKNLITWPKGNLAFRNGMYYEHDMRNSDESFTALIDDKGDSHQLSQRFMAEHFVEVSFAPPAEKPSAIKGLVIATVITIAIVLLYVYII